MIAIFFVKFLFNIKRWNSRNCKKIQKKREKMQKAINENCLIGGEEVFNKRNYTLENIIKRERESGGVERGRKN
jgi:hypothetical protein